MTRRRIITFIITFTLLLAFYTGIDVYVGHHAIEWWLNVPLALFFALLLSLTPKD